jgi:hypothetical protein
MNESYYPIIMPIVNFIIINSLHDFKKNESFIY